VPPLGLHDYDDEDDPASLQDQLPRSEHQQNQHYFAPILPSSFASFGRVTEYEMDPDVVAVHAATIESSKESIFMMCGFSMFAVIPSLLFLWIPVFLQDNAGDGTATSSPTIQPTSLIICLTACIMWCLGVWKSNFLDSNWLLFGSETVVVLLVCIVSAYSIGFGLKYFLLPEGVVLRIVTHS
jgi:hypothetical protein